MMPSPRLWEIPKGLVTRALLRVLLAPMPIAPVSMTLVSMTLVLITLVLITLAGMLTCATPALAWPGTVLRVQDGDSLLVSPENTRQPGVIVRLYGVDAPELHQQGGKAARAALEQLLPRGQVINVENMDTDAYGRIVGLVRVAGNPVNSAMLAQGQAWFNSKFCRAAFCDEWKKLERRARKQHIGLWASPRPEPPWSWRKKNPRKAD